MAWRCIIIKKVRMGWAAAVLMASLFSPLGQCADPPPSEHESHHPAGDKPPAASPPDPASAPMASAGPGAAPMGGAPSAGSPAGGMGAMMGKMMEGMGKPPPKQLYPSLMELPSLTPERRLQIEGLAHERMKAGAALMSQGFERLSSVAATEDYAGQQEATAQAREGMAQFESGLAARRALAEGKSPRFVALDWFKSEMDLNSSPSSEEPRARRGITTFHRFMMILLIAFALAMLTLYFFKMRRAAALFGRLGPGTKPPPGAAPPIAGAPGPSEPPPGGSPAPGSPPKTGDKKPAGPAPTSKEPSATPPSPAADAASPMKANWKGFLRVGGIVTETPNVKTFRLFPASNEPVLPFTFIPGQFINLAFWIGGARMNRSYSISSSPTQRDYVDLTIRREPRGAVSRHIDDLVKIGEHIEAGGPVGKFTFTGSEAKSVVLISGGVGITPMMSISRYLTDRAWPGEIFFVYTCHAPSDFIFAKEVAALERRNPKLRVAVTISKTEGTDWKGRSGRISKEWLMQVVPDLASRRIHLCGPPTMMDATKSFLTELGVPPANLKTEAFGTPKPPVSAPGTTAEPTAPATGPLVTFSKNAKEAKIHTGQTILELSEELGIGIEFSCRVGTCGVCKVKMTAGVVDQEVQDALDEDDKSKGIILACQAKPKDAVTVEA